MEEKLKKDLQDRTSKKIIFTRIVIKRMYGKAKKKFREKNLHRNQRQTKELVLVQGARVHFSRHNSPNSRALADLERSGRTERH